MSSEENDLVRRLQAKADGLRKEPLQLLLAKDPGPYQLPLCTRVSVHILDSDTAQLILDTESDQRILVPLSVDLLAALKGTIAAALTPRHDDSKLGRRNAPPNALFASAFALRFNSACPPCPALKK